MNLLLVAPEQGTVPGNGSVEICMLSIAKQLALHHKVTLVSRQGRGLPNRSQLGNLTLIRVPAGSKALYQQSVLRFIDRHTFDWIQVDNRPHLMAEVKSRFPRVPVSLFLHSLTFVPVGRKVASSLAKADVIIANSRSLRLELTKRFPHQAKKLRTVHLGVDVSRFNVKPRRSKPHTSFRVLFTGRVIPRKGVPVLIKAVALLRRVIPQSKLIVVGKASRTYLKRLRAVARQHRVPARFTGKIPHSRIHSAYSRADVFVCPSQRHEAFGLVNVEAMASGLPVVASDIGGIGEIVKHGRNGFLVKRYRLPQAFANALIKLGKRPRLAVRLGRQGRQDVLRRFGWNRTAAKLISSYSHVIK